MNGEEKNIVQYERLEMLAVVFFFFFFADTLQCVHFNEELWEFN